MELILKHKKKILIASAIIVLIAMLSTLIVKHVDNKYANLDSETRRAMTYEQVGETGNYVNYIKEDGSTGDECKFIEFNAFFTRDLNNDGYAERIKGTCKDLSATDTLYAEVNVLTKGHLENGKITLNANNFRWKTAIVEDNIVEGDYIGETSEIRLKDQVQNGSQKLLWGTISQNIGNNINNYSNTSSMTLTGTYVDDDGNRTEIEKTVDLIVDWYGTTKTSISTYEDQIYDIETILKDDKVVMSFETKVSETAKQLLLQKQETQITIPQLNGYSALEVKVADNKDYNYNKETSVLTITKSAVVNENGEITSSIARNTTDTIEVEYPLEAYYSIEASSIVLNIPVVGYNYGYNNPNEEFENPYISTAEAILSVVYSRPSGNIWNVYAMVGNRGRVRDNINTFTSIYEVSKKEVMDIYNGNIYEEKNTIYPVLWDVTVEDYTAISEITLEEQDVNNANKSDAFLNTSNEYLSMYDYIKTTGIYFSNATNLLGNDGWIKLYNKETGSLLETFTASTWEIYTESNPYEVDLKSIKIETSRPVKNTFFIVNQIKELDDKLLTDNFTQEEFDNLSYIYTYLKGEVKAPDGIIYDNGTSTSTINKNEYAYYNMPYSVAYITLSSNQINNQSTKNMDFNISTRWDASMEEMWKNGIFLIELPESIININVKNITSSNDKVKITACETYEENGKRYIKVYTKNDEETIFNIKVNADITANPIEPATTDTVNLYYYNESCDKYYNTIEDIFDIDQDELTNDYVGYTTTDIAVIAPSGLITAEYITDYDDNGSITVAPNEAILGKVYEQKTATINVGLVNNYSGTISDIVILGKIPFKGNRYVLDNQELNSKYTANIIGPITIPEQMQEAIKVYYSSNESPTKDIENASNGWKIAEEVTDWNDIKSYLIDFREYALETNEIETFKYQVVVPSNVEYNTATYSAHAVYFNLDTDQGKLATSTEPNKVGIKVEKKYDLQLTKNKVSYDEMFVQGATYSITTTDEEENNISKTATTDANGNLTFNGIYVGTEYTLKEILSPNDYILNTNEVKFKSEINENGELVFNVLNGKFKQTPELIKNENGDYLVKVQVEDESKYTLTINKTDKNGEALKNAIFEIAGKLYKTNENGMITIIGLELNKDYEIKETFNDGYYVNQEAKKFKLIRNKSNTLEMITEENLFKSISIVEENGVAQAIVTCNVQNEKIPTYNLQVLKVQENENEDQLIPLTGAIFKLVSEDTGTYREYTVDENGYINISGLYEYVEGRYITGKYILQETKAPDGYSNNSEQIKFVVKQNDDGTLEASIDNEEELTTLKSITVEGNILKIIVQDKPLFTLTKIDSETGEKLANAKFVIYEIDNNGSVIDYAKDVNGDFVGEKNEDGDYVVTTDENGNIFLPLRGGKYKIVEIGYPEGYQKNDNVEYFEVLGGTDIELTEEKRDKYTMNYIEDLVDLSNLVSKGNNYSGNIIKLARTLDFTDDSSYRNPNDTSYGDLNKDGEIKGIKAELTDTEDGIGFTPIGNSDKAFSGTFDGQGHEINNIYINPEVTTNYIGLFGYINGGEVKNLGISGDITSTSTDYCNIGGIAGNIYSTNINNCYNMGNVSIGVPDSRGYYNAGGIAGYVSNSSSINNCYNLGRIYSLTCYAPSLVGGIAGSANSSDIDNCYNVGDIISNSTKVYCYAGGIVAFIGGSKVSSCYNTGNVASNTISGNSSAGGIICYNGGSTITNSYYSDKIEITGTTIDSNGTVLPDSYMKTYDFVNDLGMKNWNEDENHTNSGYPILSQEFNIKYIEQLVYLSKSVNEGNTYENETIKLLRTLDFNNISSYYNPNDTSYGDLNGDGNEEGIKAELTKESGIGFTPIGNSSKPFSGTFNGQGYEIQNLYINSSNNNVGLFGCVIEGTIENLGVTGRISNTTSWSYMGGIAGFIRGSTIIGCHNMASIVAANNYSGPTIGIGGIAGEAVSSSINSCYNTGNINGSNISYCYVGGIVGRMYGNSYISSCYNIRSINGRSTNNSCYVGGIAGSADYICYSYNVGDITGGYAGGIVGGSSNILKSYYLNSITIRGSNINSNGEALTSAYMKSDEFIEKLAFPNWYRDYNNINNGYPVLSKQTEVIKEIKYIEDLVDIATLVNNGNTYAGKTIKLTKTLDFNNSESYRAPNDTSYGDLNRDGKVEGVKSELTNTVNGVGFTPIGNDSNTFSGTFDGQGYEIRNLYINSTNLHVGLFGCINGGKVINLGISGKINSKTAGKERFIGGIAGATTDSTIKNCYTGIDISVYNSNFNSKIGGIIGNADNTNIYNSYNRGNISASIEGTDVSGEMCVGGIVAIAQNSNISRVSNSGNIFASGNISSAVAIGGISEKLDSSTLKTSYNLGNVICTNKGNQANAGGLVCINKRSDISNCYNKGEVNAHLQRLFYFW